MRQRAKTDQSVKNILSEVIIYRYIILNFKKGIYIISYLNDKTVIIVKSPISAQGRVEGIF